MTFKPDASRYIHPEFTFVQYFNPEIGDLYGIKQGYWTKKAYFDQCIRLSRYGLLFGRRGIVMPASYLYEVNQMKPFLKAISIPRQFGLVHYASSTADLSIYRGKKKGEYRDELVLFPAYASGNLPKVPRTGLVWVPRVERSSSGDITKTWQTEVELENGFWHECIGHNAKKHFSLISKLEDQLHNVPKNLRGRAFIYRFVEPLLPFPLQTSEETRAKMLISAAYLESYLSELKAAILVETPLGDLSCRVPKLDRNGHLLTISLLHFVEFLDQLNIRHHFENNLNWYDIVRLRGDGDFLWLSDLFLRFEASGLQITHELARYLTKSIYPIPGDCDRGRIYSSVLDRVKYFRENISNLIDKGDDSKSNQLSLFPGHNVTMFMSNFRETQILLYKGSPMREPVQIAIIIALEEEFLIFRQHFGNLWQAEHNVQTNEYYYRFQYPTALLESSYCCIAAFVGRMGHNEIASTLRRILDLYNPQLVVNLGIAGALKDTLLTDIVVAEVVENYFENAKASQSESGRNFPFQLSGEPFRPTREIVNLILNMEFAYPEIHANYMNSCAHKVSELLVPAELADLRNRNLLFSPGRRFTGHIASGSIVGADEDFTRFLLEHDRNYLCLEMESGGILNEIESSCEGIKSLIIRGVSDFADNRKYQLENQFRKRLRSAAMHNSINAFEAVLKTGNLTLYR